MSSLPIYLRPSRVGMQRSPDYSHTWKVLLCCEQPARLSFSLNHTKLRWRSYVVAPESSQNDVKRSVESQLQCTTRSLAIGATAGLAAGSTFESPTSVDSGPEFSGMAGARF